MSFQVEFHNDILRGLLIQATPSAVVVERRVYYDDQGKVITYTCENLPGNYIVISPEQFSEARPDAVVRDGKLVYTHRHSHVSKLEPADAGVCTSRHDINVLVPEHDPDAVHWKVTVREISSDL